MTIAEAFENARRSLQYEGSFEAAEAHTAARLLLDAAIDVRHAHLMEPHREMTAAESATLNAYLHEAQQGRPIPYILGHREFYGLTFLCDERGLIPRPETELLVETALARLSDVATPRIADLGTGTGCIAISLTTMLPAAEIFATDFSPAALELAAENARRLDSGDRVHFVAGIEGEWAAPLREQRGTFDAILTNPPYIAQEELAGLQREVRDWEPRSALVAGDDGLDCYRQIAAQCRSLLKPTGFLLAEMGAGQFEAAVELFEAAGWSVDEPLHDLAGIARVLQARPTVSTTPKDDNS